MIQASFNKVFFLKVISVKIARLLSMIIQLGSVGSYVWTIFILLGEYELHVHYTQFCIDISVDCELQLF